MKNASISVGTLLIKSIISFVKSSFLHINSPFVGENISLVSGSSFVTPLSLLTFSILHDLGIKESGLDKLIKATYDLLGLATYFTAGEDECRAWTFKKGMKAPECAGIIHSDFERGFIKAEIMSYEDLEKYGTELKVKEAGRLRLEGKEYVMQDGDICHFRFNV